MRELEKKETTKRKELDTECFVLWKQISKTTNYEYLTGHDLHGRKLVGFYSPEKKNPKEPDIRVYLSVEKGKESVQVASLWENLSKNDKRYLTGTTTDNEKLRGFYSDEPENTKKPLIRVYFNKE